MNSKTNTVRAILLDASECDRPEANHPATIEICADDLQRILERHITEPAQCLHQIAEPAAPVVKPIKDAIDALVMAAFTEGGCSEHRMSEARIQTELRKKELRTLLSTPQPCSRSHPHEEMTPMCELRTEIARLTNALARAEAQRAAAPQAVQAAVPVLFVSREQLESHTDHLASEAGRYLPARKTAVGKFTMPLYAHPAEGVPAQAVGEMTAERASYFMRRFLKEEKLLGPNEQAALHYVISLLAATQPSAQGLEADGVYYLQDARHHAMVGNCPSFWREGGGYTTNLDEAERFTLEAAMKQHKCRETDLPWLCSEVDKLRRPTVDCQYMPRSWDAQRAALAAQAKQGGAA
nr:hypothetical protein [uncultured Comamonas sp.]